MQSTEEKTELHPSELEMMKLQTTGSTLMAQMVEESLAASHMPPAPVMEWFCLFMLHNMIMIEHDVVLMGNGSEEADTSLKSAVAAVSSLLRITEKSKLLRLNHDMEKALLARKIRYPTHMDLTYGGLLP